MARVELHKGVTLKGARRIMTRRGASFRLTLRYGHVYTFRKFTCRQPNSASQLRCRNLLIQANRLAKEDLQRPGRLDFWLRKAKTLGYKTALGCARAHFIASLKASASRPVSDFTPVPRKAKVTRPIYINKECSSACKPANGVVVNIWRSADLKRSISLSQRAKHPV